MYRHILALIQIKVRTARAPMISIETPDGRLIYFHRNSVVDADVDGLRIGADVRFDEEEGDRGPQATTVHVLGKHHIVG